MRNIRADEVTAFLRKRKYRIEGDLITIVSNSNETIANPFASYKANGKRDSSQSPHFEFINVDLDDNKSIEDFYNKWGKLGIFETQFEMITNMNDSSFSDGSHFSGKLRSTGSLVPLDELKTSYNIVKRDKTNTDLVEDNIYFEADYDVLETVSDFKEWCTHFKSVFEIKEAFVNRDFEYMENYLRIRNGSYKAISQEDTLNKTLFYLNSEIIHRISNNVIPVLGLQNGDVVTHWKVDSLLNALHLMLFLDITGNYIAKRCNKKTCPKWFEAENSRAKYCSPECQNSEKQARYRLLKGVGHNG